MHYRPAKLEDVPALASVASRAFENSGMKHWLYSKNPDLYMQEAYNRWFMTLRDAVLQPNWMVWLGETDKEDHPEGEYKGPVVTGFSNWTYVSDTIHPEFKKDGLWHTLQRVNVEARKKLWAWSHKDLASDPEAFEKLKVTVESILKDVFTGKYANAWHCHHLATDPAWQRRGVGSQVASWGIQQAKRDVTTAGLEASTEGLPMYLKLGMKHIGPYVGAITFDNVLQLQNGFAHAVSPSIFLHNPEYSLEAPVHGGGDHTTTVTVTATAPPPIQTPPASRCNTGSLQCCNSIQAANAGGLGTLLLGLLNIVVDPINGLIGVTCSPINLLGIGAGGACTAQPVCCENNNFVGVVAIGCTPINVGL